jgi:RHS repeat-associated protein
VPPLVPGPADFEATPTFIDERPLWGPAVDMLLADNGADERDDAGDAGTAWTVLDTQNTVRDHIATTYGAGGTFAYGFYGGYGQTSETPSMGTYFGFTGQLTDADTGLQLNGERWYNPDSGTWMSEDPIGFDGGQTNLREYCGNSPTNGIDPSGLASHGVLPLTPDQKKLLDLANGDPDLRHSLLQLIYALRDHPTKNWAPWPFAHGDRCHAWVQEGFAL